MFARASSGLGLSSPHSAFLTFLKLLSLLFGLTPLLCASTFSDTASQMARKIAAASGPGAFTIEISNRSSLDDKSLRQIRGDLEYELHSLGVQSAKTDQSAGAISIVLSESLREYVWTAAITIGSDEKKFALVSTPRPFSSSAFNAAPTVILKSAFLFEQERPILDAALVEIDIPSASRLLVLESDDVAIYHHLPGSGRWELETALPIIHSRAFPRDLRGRLFLRRDHLFDAYLPGTLCRSSATAPLTLSCTDTDDPWPLAADDNSVRGFYAAARNFFTGAISPAIGKISNVPAFYSVAVLPRANYPLWVFTAVDGSVHLVDGITDQRVRGMSDGKDHWGSDLAAVRSPCGMGTQLIVSESGSPERDALRVFEIADRDPATASSPLEFDGEISALWPSADSTGAVAIVRHKSTGWYEADRISISCGN
jgi:hypothetical protein